MSSTVCNNEMNLEQSWQVCHKILIVSSPHRDRYTSILKDGMILYQINLIYSITEYHFLILWQKFIQWYVNFVHIRPLVYEIWHVTLATDFGNPSSKKQGTKVNTVPDWYQDTHADKLHFHSSHVHHNGQHTQTAALGNNCADGSWSWITSVVLCNCLSEGLKEWKRCLISL